MNTPLTAATKIEIEDFAWRIRNNAQIIRILANRHTEGDDIEPGHLVCLSERLAADADGLEVTVEALAVAEARS